MFKSLVHTKAFSFKQIKYLFSRKVNSNDFKKPSLLENSRLSKLNTVEITDDLRSEFVRYNIYSFS